jgi:transposase-like protein
MDNPTKRRFRNKGGRPGKFPESQKRQIVFIVLKENISLNKAAIRFGVSRPTISSWVHKYYNDIEQTTVIETMKDNDIVPQIPAEQIQEYEDKLRQAHLKISALETMIELAENTYKIAIRKNSGTKQHGY